MDDVDRVRVELVREWEMEPIVELYRTAGWWKEGMDASRIGELIKGSFLFTVAIDISTGESVGMGRVISDGIADAYIQDVVVLPEWRSSGVGMRILSALLEGCRAAGIAWIGLIAEPGAAGFYRSVGFAPMEGYIPMLLSGR